MYSNKKSLFISFFIFLLCLLPVFAIQAEQHTITDDFLVNDDTTVSDQQATDIAIDYSGNFVITWQDARNDSTYCDIYAQMYNITDTPLGLNFKVNDVDTGTAGQENPAIAMNDYGNFVITWEDDRFDHGHVRAQKFNPSGTPFELNFYVALGYRQYYDKRIYFMPAIGLNKRKEFIIAFTRYYSEWMGNPSTWEGVTSKRYDSLGIDKGWIEVDGSSACCPALTWITSDNFVITWFRRFGHLDINAGRYDSAGILLGSKFKVNDDNGTDDQVYPSIASDSTGDFIITWVDRRNGNWDIYAQRYDSAGSALDSNFMVNDNTDTTDTTEQLYPDIAMAPSGNFIIVWEDYRNVTGGVYAQKYDSLGNPVGKNFFVPNPQYACFEQRRPAVAANDSKIYFVWQDNRRNKGWDIFAKVVDWYWTEVEEEQEHEDELPVCFELSQNYPNPFNPSTTILFTVNGSRKTVNSAIRTTLKIYNIQGQLVRTLVDEEKPNGNYSVIWDGKDEEGKEVSSGIYFYRIKAEDFVLTKKMVLIK